MARGRHQKWICKQCKAEFTVQNQTPKFCCSCGSVSIGRAPSYELADSFDEKRQELREVCMALNPVYRQFMDLKAKYDQIMAYWKQQRTRGYISKEEYAELACQFEGSKQPQKIIEDPDMPFPVAQNNT